MVVFMVCMNYLQVLELPTQGVTSTLSSLFFELILESTLVLSFSLGFLCFNIERIVLPKLEQAVMMYEVTVSVQKVLLDRHSTFPWPPSITICEEQKQLSQHNHATTKANILQASLQLTLILIQMFDSWCGTHHAYL